MESMGGLLLEKYEIIAKFRTALLENQSLLVVLLETLKVRKRDFHLDILLVQI